VSHPPRTGRHHGDPSVVVPQRRPPGPAECLRILNAFAISMLQQRGLEDLLWCIAENTGELLGFEDCVIYLRRGGELHQGAALGVKNPCDRVIKNRIVVPVGQGVVGRVAQTAEPLLVHDTGRFPGYIRDDYPGLSELAVPVVYQGRVLAVLDSEAARVGAFDRNDLDLFQSVANIAATRIASALDGEHRRLAEQELQRAKEALEERVRARTHELGQTVRRLEREVIERRRAEQALEDEKKQLALILDAVGDGLFAVDAGGRIVAASGAALRLTGWSREAAIGRRLDEVYRTAPQEDDTARLLQDRAGEEHVLDEVVSEIRDPDGAVVGSVVVFRDVTKERALELDAQSAQRMESLGLLAGGIAHDFNNVLTGVLGQVNLAQLRIHDPNEVEEALALAEKGCLTARGLTKELLAFAKGGTPVVSVGSLRELILESVRFCLVGSSVTAHLEIDEDLEPVDMDRIQISQVRNNLLLNALQSMPEGGQIEVRAKNGRNDTTLSADLESRDAVVVTIRDHGAGIAKDQLERIFDPYYSTKGKHSGLGLATSFWIVRRHRGSLRLLESSGRGTTFEMRLPVATEMPEVASSRTSTLRGDSLRILLMDDEEPVRTTVAAMLRRLEHSVTTAACGEEALELYARALAEDAPFELVLLDLTVRGGLGGLETLKRLRAIEPGFHAVVISGYSDDPVVSSHRAHGFDDRLEKPFTMGQLGELLARVTPGS
jgi:PAS domain S-box-containing protein